MRVRFWNAAGEEVKALRLETTVLPHVPLGEERLYDLIVGTCFCTKANGPDEPRALTPLEVAAYQLCRPDGTVRLEFYASEMDAARERLEE